MKKQHLRISIYNGGNSLCDKLASMAARFNGGEKTYDLPTLETCAKVEILQMPMSNAGVTVSLIGDTLMVDRVVVEGNPSINVMAIELVEILVLAPTLEPEY